MEHVMKRIHYRVGLPGWKVAARVGLPLSFRAYVHRDSEAKMFWAVSPDIDGLTVEGATLDEVIREVSSAADVLIELQLGKSTPAEPIVSFDGALSAA